MDDKWANIDIVFRNGLKDFEVLPPQEVWDKINPLLKRKRKQLVLMRAAALIAAILLMSFLAYRWSREVSTRIDGAVTALSVEASSPLISNGQQNITGDKGNIIANSIQGRSTKDILAKARDAEVEKTFTPGIAYLLETNTLSIRGVESHNSSFLLNMNSSKKNSFEIKSVDQQFVPESSPINSTKRWSVSAMGSPTYYSQFESGNDAIAKQLIASEQPVVSYSGGVAFSYKINKRFSIQSGLFYSSLGKKVDGINAFSGFQNYDYTKGDHNFEVLTASGTVYTSNADVFLIERGPGERILTNYTIDVFDPTKANLQYINNTLHQNFNYLELPVVLRYKFIDKTIDLNLIGGISYNLLVKNSVYTMIDGNKYPIGKTEGLNLITLSSSLGLGMEYSFSNSLSLNLEPMFRYYINPFNEVTGSKNHPYSFGLFSGISFKF